MLRDRLLRLRTRTESLLHPSTAQEGSTPLAPRLPLLPGEALLAMRNDPLAFLCGAARDRGDVVALGWGRKPLLLLVHPDHAHHVFVEHVRRYDKNTRGYRTLAIFLGQGLLTAEGERWRQSRRIAQPAFHRERIAGFASTIVEMTSELMNDWAQRRDAIVDMHEEMTRLTLRIVAKTLLGTDLDAHDRVGPALARLNAFARHMISHPWTLPPSVPTPRTLRYRRSAAVLDTVVLDIIAQRRRDPGPRTDLLGMLMDAADEETGATLSDAQLRDEAMTIFVAGHETTAAALAWTLALLSLHPDVDRRLAEELEVLGGRPPELSDLPKLPYTLAVLKESLRLYPPAWAISRHAREDDELGGFHVPAGSLVLLSPYVTHRHPEFWADPETFDPERFTPDAERARPRFAYFPFGGGQRLCIGQSFALMEAQLVLATLRQRFAPTLVAGHRLQAEPLITLRPKGGIPMRISQR